MILLSVLTDAARRQPAAEAESNKSLRCSFFAFHRGRSWNPTAVRRLYLSFCPFSPPHPVLTAVLLGVRFDFCLSQSVGRSLEVCEQLALFHVPLGDETTAMFAIVKSIFPLFCRAHTVWSRRLPSACSPSKKADLQKERAGSAACVSWHQP